MNLKELSNLIDSNIIESNESVETFKTNTKELTKNDIFIALNNGHKYLNAIKKCKAVIVENDFKSDKFPVLKVKSTKESLIKIAEYKRKNYKGKVIVITGSNGKTTTKELLSYILKRQYKVFKSFKNMNNDIGVPINMLSLNNSEIAVFELGMNHLKEISYLSKLLKPDIGIITNIGTAHIGNLGNKKNIFKAKMEILDGMKEKNLFVNGNDDFLKNSKYTKVTFENDLFCLNNIKEYRDYVSFDLNIEKKYHIKYHIPSIIQLNNVLLAIYISLYLKVKPKKIVYSLNHFKTIEQRLEKIKLKDKIIINDSYNSNYESLMSGIETLKNYKEDKICIIGSILELGASEKEIYEKISKNLNKEYEYIFVGKKIKTKNSLYFENVDELIRYYENNKNKFKNKIIYVKGSNKVNLIKFVKQIIE